MQPKHRSAAIEGQISDVERFKDTDRMADVILVMEIDFERTKKLTEPNQALILHIVKNRGGEKGKLAFEFVPAFSKFTEVAPASISHA